MPRKPKETQRTPEETKPQGPFPEPPPGSDQGTGNQPAGPAVGDARIGGAQLGGPRVLLSYKKPLPYVLTPEELRQKSLDLTATFHEIDNEAAFQKRTKDTLKSRISGLVNKQRELLLVVETGKEDREVEVDDILVGNFVETTRRDTGEVLSRRDPKEASCKASCPSKTYSRNPKERPTAATRTSKRAWAVRTSTIGSAGPSRTALSSKSARAAPSILRSADWEFNNNQPDSTTSRLLLRADELNRERGKEGNQMPSVERRNRVSELPIGFPPRR